MSPRDPADVFRDWIDAWNRGDIEGFVALLTPDVEWYDRPEFPDAGVYRGREATGRHLEDLAQTIDAVFEPVAFEQMGDRLLVDMKVRFRGPESGAAVAQDLYSVVVVREGLIARRENFSTREEAVAAASGR